MAAPRKAKVANKSQQG